MVQSEMMTNIPSLVISLLEILLACIHKEPSIQTLLFFLKYICGVISRGAVCVCVCLCCLTADYHLRFSKLQQHRNIGKKPTPDLLSRGDNHRATVEGYWPGT